MHLILQMVVAIIRKKKANNKPAKIAPITLVAANSTAKSTNDTKIVPMIPIDHAVLLAQLHFLTVSQPKAVVARPIARYKTAIPNTTHRNAGVRVITAIKVRKAVIIPTIILPITATPRQLDLKQQL